MFISMICGLKIKPLNRTAKLKSALLAVCWYIQTHSWPVVINSQQVISIWYKLQQF